MVKQGASMTNPTLPFMALLAAAWTAIAPSSVSAQEPAQVSGLNFLVDHREMVGKRVLVDRCTLAMANASVVFCYVMNGRHDIGHLTLQSDTMNRDHLRRALADCATYPHAAKPACRASVSGVVEKPTGKVPLLSQAEIQWPK